MKLFVTLTKKSLAMIFAVTIMLIIIIGQVFSADSGRIDGSTNAIRVTYLKSLGLEVDDSDVTSKNIVIPENFGEVYNEYNSLQKKSGFDLADYKGEEAVVYTYSLDSPENCQVHLIIYDDAVIGGDIASVKLDGEMLPLNYMK